MFDQAKNKPPALDASMSYIEIKDACVAIMQYYNAALFRIDNINKFAKMIETMALTFAHNMLAEVAIQHSNINSELCMLDNHMKRIIYEKIHAENRDKCINPGLTNEFNITIKPHDDPFVVNTIRLKKFNKAYKVTAYIDMFHAYCEMECHVTYDAVTDILKIVNINKYSEMSNGIFWGCNIKKKTETSAETYMKELGQIRKHDSSAITEISVIIIPPKTDGLFNGCITEKFVSFPSIAIKTQNQNLHLIYMGTLRNDNVDIDRTRYIGFIETNASLDNIAIAMTDEFYLSNSIRKFCIELNRDFRHRE
jgi:hypothetical protein